MNKKSFTYSVILFTINPFFFTLFVILITALVNDRRNILSKLSFISMLVYACLVQTQRVWGYGLNSDWNSNVYEGLFLEAGFTNFFEYVFTKKEPLWNVLNYIGYYLTDGSPFHFFNGIAIVTIVLLLRSVYIYWQKSGASPVVLISSLAFIVFFVEFSSNLNNLLRQYFALSIIVFAYTKEFSNSKHSLYVLLAASLIHTIGFIFFIFHLIKPLHQKLKVEQLLKIIAVGLVIAAVLSQASALQGFFSAIPFLGYAFYRISTASTPHSFDDIIDPSVIFVNGAVVLFFPLIMMLLNKNIGKKMVFYANILMGLMLLSMITAVVAPMLMTRLYISRFFIFPFVIPYIFLNARGYFFKIAKLPFSWAITVFFIYWFVSRFDSIRGGGFFPPIDELVMYSLFDFIF